MVFSAIFDPHFCRLSFLSKSKKSTLVEALVSAAESIGCNTTGALSDGAQSVEPPFKKWSVLDHLLGEERQDDKLSIQDEVRSYFQERPIKILYDGRK